MIAAKGTIIIAEMSSESAINFVHSQADVIQSRRRSL
jgi:hypothetical protein